jgi:hypothetical protein
MQVRDALAVSESTCGTPEQVVIAFRDAAALFMFLILTLALLGFWLGGLSGLAIGGAAGLALRYLVMCQNPTHLDPARSAVFSRRWGGQCSPTATVATVVP